MASPEDVQWLTSADGSQRAGFRVIGTSHDPRVELFSADGDLIATLDATGAADLVRQLQTATDFAAIVGHDRFVISVAGEGD